MPKPPEIVVKDLPYVESLEPRPLDAIDLVVIHCTELPDLSTARDYGERVLYTASGTGNSGHYYVERNGTIEQWVPLDRVAHHVKRFNKHSIGIELVNSGRFPDWFDSRSQEMTEPYTTDQIRSLLALLGYLCERLPRLSLISGHSELDTSSIQATDNENVLLRRKTDPGPLFPWKEVLRKTRLNWFEPCS